LLTQALRDETRRLEAGVRDERDELLPAVAPHRVLGTQRRAQAPRDDGEHAIPDVVAVKVVDRLEMVDVHEQDAEAAAPLAALVHRPLEGASVQDAREGIDLSILLQQVALAAHALQD